MRQVHRSFSYLLLALCLAIAPLAAKVTETVDRSFDLGESGIVTVSNINGSIEIKASDGGQVTLHAVKTADNARGLESISVNIDEAPGRLEIETEHQKTGWFGSGGNASVSYELTVPRGTEVQAKSVNGAVKVTQIRGDVFAKTVNGEVRLTDLGGAVKAETVNGSLRAGISESSAATDHKFKTVNGSVQVSLPSDVTGSFQADTLNGSIKTDFPLEVKKPKYHGQKTINARLGDGGSSYSFSTVNGSIKILEN